MGVADGALWAEEAEWEQRARGAGKVEEWRGLGARRGRGGGGKCGLRRLWGHKGVLGPLRGQWEHGGAVGMQRGNSGMNEQEYRQIGRRPVFIVETTHTFGGAHGLPSIFQNTNCLPYNPIRWARKVSSLCLVLRKPRLNGQVFFFALSHIQLLCSFFHP